MIDKSMKITLQGIDLKNFKGIRKFSATFDGLNAVISGPNGAGKSVIADALNWLLFNKNQAGESSFGVKPIGPDGEEVHYMEHSVNAALSIDPGAPAGGPETGHTVTLCKVMKEKWTKKRGSQTPEFGGHETTYYIDKVPKKESEYKDYIAGLVREDVFRLITSITHFNAMKWQDRRKLLLEVAGTISDYEIIVSDDRFSEIPGWCANRSFDDTLKMFRSQRPKINDELYKLPARITEAEDAKPAELACMPPSGVPAYAELTAKLTYLQNSRAAMMAGDTSSIRERIAAKRQEIADITNEHRIKCHEAEDTIRSIQNKAGELQIKLAQLKADQDLLARELMVLHQRRRALLADWRLNRQILKATSQDCPTCGQPLSEDNAQAAEMKKARLETAAANVSRIEEVGKAKAVRVKEIEVSLPKIEKEIARISAEITGITDRADAVPMPEPPDMGELNDEIAKLERELKSPGAVPTEVSCIDDKISMVQAGIRAHDEAAANRKLSSQQDERVTELKDRKKSLGIELDALDSRIATMEDFIRARVSRVTEEVSTKFAPLSFKLFDMQINGGIAETCETLVPSPEGVMVPWGDCNTGHRILAGIRIVQVFSEHYGVHAPVFVDNAEALTMPIADIGSQVIRLVARDEAINHGVRLHVELQTAEVAF